METEAIMNAKSYELSPQMAWLVSCAKPDGAKG
jgi:hypothetical protein